jgi:hypothetical protein
MVIALNLVWRIMVRSSATEIGIKLKPLDARPPNQIKLVVVVSLQLLADVGFWCGSSNGLVFFAMGFWLLASCKTKPLAGCVMLLWRRAGFFGGGFVVDLVLWWRWWRRV